MSADAASGEATSPGPSNERRTPDWLALSGLAVFAFMVRLTPLLLGSGLGFMGRYDDGVYYTAADAVSFGRVPYKDFVLVHPPGITLVLLPFAWLGRATTDLTGMETARLAFMAIGAANTVLVALIARRWGRPAMFAAGLVYACWQPAVYSEQTTFLEPVGGLLLLIALFLLVKRERVPTPRAEIVAGFCLGAAATVKIWYLAPWAVLVVWQLLSRRPKSASRIVIAGVGMVAGIVTPFAVMAGQRMDQLVIRDQLFRKASVDSRTGRISGMVGVRSFTDGQLGLRHVLVVVLVAFFVLVLLTTLRDHDARPLIALLVVNSVVLLAAPVFLRHYSAFIAGPQTVLVGVAIADWYRSPRLRRVAPFALTGVVVLCLASAVAIAFNDGGHRFPASKFEAVTPSGCITADDPLALVEVNRLSSDFRAHCAVDVDVSGVLLDKYDLVDSSGHLVPKWENPGWQRYLYDYLTGARAFILSRPRSDGIFGPVVNAYARFPLIARGRDFRDFMRLGTGPP